MLNVVVPLFDLKLISERNIIALEIIKTLAERIRFVKKIPDKPLNMYINTVHVTAINSVVLMGRYFAGMKNISAIRTKGNINVMPGMLILAIINSKTDRKSVV